MRDVVQWQLLFYDSKDGLYKMWYQAGWFDGTAYAESLDGQNWYRPDLDVVPGTNMVLPFRKGYKRDGATVWIDHETKDPKSRYKLFVFFRKLDRVVMRLASFIILFEKSGYSALEK